MRKIKQRFQNLAIKYLQLPQDVLLELPRITLIGHIHAYIENHRGLLVYSDTELRLKTNKGAIQILGDSFVLKTMLPEEIILEGTISDIKFIPE